MRKGVLELVAEGGMPAFAGLDRLLTLTDRIRVAVRDGAHQASRAGQSMFTVEVPFSDADQRFVTDMGESLLSYVEVLTMQGKLEATPPAPVLEAMAALEQRTDERTRG